MTLRIVGIDGQAEGLTVVAQFNPKEITVDRSIDWRQQPTQPAANLEYAGSAATTMMFELTFDGFESGTSVQPEIAKIHQLSDVDTGLKRPPKVRVAYGTPRTAGVIPAFEGVIEAFSVKYLMFAANGVPVRATVSLKFKQASKIKVGVA